MSRSRRDELDWHRQSSQARFNNGAPPRSSARKARKSYSYNWDLSDGLVAIAIVVLVLLGLSTLVPGGLA